MRILWQSVSPFAPSGYGTMTSVWVPYLKRMGHEMAIYAYFGVMGSKLDWGDIPMYPNNDHDYGVNSHWMFYEEFKPDIMLSLTDTWVLNGLDPRVKWIPWCVSGDTKVITPDGEIEIQDAEDIKEVLAILPNGVPEWARVKAFHKLPCYTDVFKILTNDKQITITGENEVLTSCGWKQASCIVSGDMVYCDYNEPYNSDTMGIYSRLGRRGGQYWHNNQAKVREENCLSVMGESRHFQPERASNGLVETDFGLRLHESPSPNRITPNKRGLNFSENRIHIGYCRAEASKSGFRENATLLDNQEGTSGDSFRVHQSSPATPLQQHLQQPRVGTYLKSAPPQYTRWQRVREIRKSGQKVKQVFDLTTETGNFFANGILIHNCPIDHDPAPPRVLNALRQIAFVKAIAMSKFGQAELGKHGIPAYYIPLSVNTQLFSPREDLRKASREIAGWNDKFVIGTVAVNCPRKNYPTTLQAIQKFAKNHNDVIYYMHTNPFDSQGYNLDAVRKALDIKDITLFPPPTELVLGITRETMVQMYNSLDVFLLPSKGEGFCLPAMEAQACGIPVIISDNTALTEMLGGGWLLKEKRLEWTGQDSWNYDCSIDEIVEYLEQAYKAKKNGSIEELKAKARAKALDYSEDRVAAYWPPVLKDIEKRIKEPKNCEGQVPWKLYFIPRECTPAKVLDIGCGVNQPYRDALSHLGEYVGIDKKPGPNVTVMDAHNLKFGDKEFGFVWCSEVLEHVSRPQKVLAEAKRVGVHGVFLFSTPADRTCFDADPDHKEVKGIEYTTIAGGDGLIAW